MKKLAVVGTFVAGAAVGLVGGGALTVRAAIKSEKVRKVIVDSIAEYLLPEPRDSYSHYHPRNNSKVSYRKYYAQIENKPLYDTREAAESTLESMRRIVEEYGYLSLQDFYDICELDMNYRKSYHTIGWMDLHDAKVEFTGRGYEIIMPETVELDV